MPETSVALQMRRARMPGSCRFGTLALLTLLLAVVGAVPARGDLITSLSATATPISGGLFFYEYTLTNESNSTQGVTDFFIDVSPFADLQSVSAPTGFIISYLPGDPEITFSSPDSTFDILPGSFGIFSFESLMGPANAAYLIRGLDGSNIGEVTGTTISPNAVPEPLSMGMFAIGGGLAGAWMRRRKVAPTSAS